MSTPIDNPHPPVVRAALVCVGGTPAPVLYVLRQVRPAHVWYFCSPDSRYIADAIHVQLDWHPDRDFVEVDRFEELGPCYRALRETIPALLKKWEVSPDEVLVDYTGGTKTMSAALVLAATELFQQFSYVGGLQREKEGLGITIDGKERVVYQTNPWNELAIREIERARDLWRHCIFEEAARVLSEAAQRAPKRLRFEALARLADAMAARHRLDFKEAQKGLGQLTKELPVLYDGQDDFGVTGFARSALSICSECMKDKASESVLRELLDNALRTAAQGRYEDAAARLYRAMELQGQIWLATATASLFINGRCKKENAAKLPEALKTLAFCKPDDEGDIKLSLEQVFLALAALGDERAKVVATDLNAKDGSGRTRSRWRAATEKRNTGVLGHGTSAIGQEGFEQMKTIASEFLGFDLSAQANPIPPLDTRWF